MINEIVKLTSPKNLEIFFNKITEKYFVQNVYLI